MIRWLILAISVLAIGGCHNKRADPVTSYQQERYELAYVQAKKMADRGGGKHRTQGRLLAGLSAEALGLDEEATGWLEPLLYNKDRHIAGRARVAMAKIEHRRGNTERTRSLLRSAIDMLEGDAALHARTIAEALGVSPTQTHATNESPALYSLQLGAFSTYRNASIQAIRTRDQALRNNLGEPRVISLTDSRGRSLYLVHVGRFTLKDDAQQALRSMGNKGLIAPYRE